MTCTYLLLGHFTRDVLPDGSFTPGGTSLYSALAAHKLGLDVGIVSAPVDLPADWPADIALATTNTSAIPTFENRYTPSGRRQILHSDAPPLRIDDVPDSWRDAPVVHLGPILGETPESLAFAFPDAIMGVTPQGWMREWGPTLPGPIRYRSWQPSPELLGRIDALILSVEDVHGDEDLVRSYARHCRLVALTRGASGSTLYINGVPHAIPTIPIIERDPTGAGDVFAAAFLAGLYHGREPREAAVFASYTAALRVSGEGRAAIPDRATVEQRMSER